MGECENADDGGQEQGDQARQRPLPMNAQPGEDRGGNAGVHQHRAERVTGEVAADLVRSADEPPHDTPEREPGGQARLVLRASRFVAEQPVPAEHTGYRQHRRAEIRAVEDCPRRAQLVVTEQDSPRPRRPAAECRTGAAAAAPGARRATAVLRLPLPTSQPSCACRTPAGSRGSRRSRRARRRPRRADETSRVAWRTGSSRAAGRRRRARTRSMRARTRCATPSSRAA